jgi:hypothetical protein
VFPYFLLSLIYVASRSPDFEQNCDIIAHHDSYLIQINKLNPVHEAMLARSSLIIAKIHRYENNSRSISGTPCVKH